MTLNKWIIECHKLAVEKGWWSKDRPIPELLMLMVTELAEAMEAYRVGDRRNLEEELADLFIRLADTCGGYGINLEVAVRKKHEFNKGRPYRHGNKVA